MMISLGSGMQALSIAMQSTIPAYPNVEIVERMNAASGAMMVSSRSRRAPYPRGPEEDKRKGLPHLRGSRSA